MSAVEIEDISDAPSSKELAAAAKAKGNKAHGLNTIDGFKEACTAYKQAIVHDPTDHIFFANLCASYIELTKCTFKAGEVVDYAARAVEAANKCTSMAPSWPKGFVRQATAEEALLKARTKWEERLAEPKTKWEEEEEARNGPEPQPDESLLAIIKAMSLATCESTCRAGLVLDPSSVALKMRLQGLRDAGHVTDSASDAAMSDVSLAAPLKAEGNTLFASKKFEEGAMKYTEALAMNPVGEGAHLLYSNRSACHCELDASGDWKGEPGLKALHDAEMCLKLSPSFAKGFSRKAAALYQLGRYADSEAAAQAGLARDPESAALKSLLATAKVETAETLEVQEQLHRMRKQKKKDAKLKAMLSGLNLGGNNVQMFNPGMGGGLGGLEAMLAGGGGGGGFGGAPEMSDEQMRQMARAMTSVNKGAPSSSNHGNSSGCCAKESKCCAKGGGCGSKVDGQGGPPPAEPNMPSRMAKALEKEDAGGGCKKGCCH